MPAGRCGLCSRTGAPPRSDVEPDGTPWEVGARDPARPDGPTPLPHSAESRETATDLMVQKPGRGRRSSRPAQPAPSPRLGGGCILACGPGRHLGRFARLADALRGRAGGARGAHRRQRSARHRLPHVDRDRCVRDARHRRSGVLDGCAGRSAATWSSSPNPPTGWRLRNRGSPAGPSRTTPRSPPGRSAATPSAALARQRGSCPGSPPLPAPAASPARPAGW